VIGGSGIGCANSDDDQLINSAVEAPQSVAGSGLLVWLGSIPNGAGSMVEWLLVLVSQSGGGGWSSMFQVFHGLRSFDPTDDCN